MSSAWRSGGLFRTLLRTQTRFICPPLGPVWIQASEVPESDLLVAPGFDPHKVTGGKRKARKLYKRESNDVIVHGVDKVAKGGIGVARGYFIAAVWAHARS